MSRMQLLEEAYASMHQYTTHADGWRPGLVDLALYNTLISIHENDADGEEYKWNDTPDHIMESIMNSGRIFDLEYGMEDLYEAVREYLTTNNFITHVDELEEEEENDN